MQYNMNCTILQESVYLKSTRIHDHRIFGCFCFVILK
nr:MAG TPA: hypothetical protein [Caudoviricetes sp.]